MSNKSVDQIITELQAVVARGEAEIARHQKAIEDTRTRINDARVTLRTLQSMGVDASARQPATEPAPGADQMTVPEMINRVLEKEGKGLEPMEVMASITTHFGVHPDPNHVRPSLWRMAKAGRLVKDDDGKYRLPSNEKPADENAVESTSAGFNFNPQHGREAGQGGGT
ncbi:MAG: hypothetical protein ABL307_14810 [Roseitalea porphyridii]|uniref:hypothetical protein n=1 Tax=Roseitalea porphyridii TaxID=1852022 RepID=UPI0032D92D19